jgi:hypothetical protein
MVILLEEPAQRLQIVFSRNDGGTVGLNKFSSRFTCFWVVVGIAAIFVLDELAEDAADNHWRKRSRSFTRFPLSSL